jgi:hypothetical protein
VIPASEAGFNQARDLIESALVTLQELFKFSQSAKSEATSNPGPLTPKKIKEKEAAAFLSAQDGVFDDVFSRRGMNGLTKDFLIATRKRLNLMYHPDRNPTDTVKAALLPKMNDALDVLEKL